MKFKSRKDIFFKLFSGIMISFLLILTVIEVYFVGLNNPGCIFVTVFMLLIVALFASHFYTKYELTKTELKYKSGLIRGKIKIEQITEVLKGKTLWSGLKPATAINGLIIKYQKYEEIYISPKTNDLFIKKLLELNKDIKITEKENPVASKDV